MQTLNETVNAWVVHPDDLERVDMATDTAGRLYLADGTSGADAIFGGLPRVPSTRVPAGTAILADWTKALLAVREDVRLDLDKSGELFTHNQVQLRAEGRFGFGLTRPQAFAMVDLTA
jgi:HK97 family phage major capsid protein